MPTNVRPDAQRTLQQSAKILPAGQSSGQFLVKAPFYAEYLAIVNPTQAAVTYSIGELSQQSADAVTVQPQLAISTEIQLAQAITVNWASSQPLPQPTPEQPNQVVFMFSNEPIQLQVAAINTGQATQVEVSNTITAIVEGSPNSGTNLYVLKTDANGNLQTIPLVGGNAVASGNPLPVITQASLIPGTTVASTPVSGTQSVAITTAATTVVKGSPGVAGTITNAGSATSGAISVYDSLTASGKLIWAGTLTAGQVQPLGIPCATGITVVTAAANTLAFSYA